MHVTASKIESTQKLAQHYKFYLSMLCTYIISRFLLKQLGVEFNANGIYSFWQLLDIQILKNNFFQSLYYQHSQPPVFNLFVGAVLKFFPNAYVSVLTTFFHLLSLAIYFLIYKTLIRLHFKSIISFLLASAYILSPTCILYENWLFTTWIATTLLTVSAYTLLAFLQERKNYYFYIFVASIILLCLTRSMFHLIFFFACIGLVWFVIPKTKPLITAIVIGFFLITSVYVKNLVLYDFFGTSSWTGMNMWNISWHKNIPGNIADPKTIQPRNFADIKFYPPQYQNVPERFSDIPSVANKYKLNGKTNYNFYGYIAISEEYKKASVYSITHFTDDYFAKVKKAWGVYFQPSWDYPFVTHNLRKIEQHPYIQFLKKPIVSQIIFTLILIYYLLIISKAFSSNSINYYFVFPSFLLMTILYVAMIGNFLELGENNRFKVQTSSYFYILFCLVIRDGLNLFRKRFL